MALQDEACGFHRIAVASGTGNEGRCVRRTHTVGIHVCTVDCSPYCVRERLRAVFVTCS